MLNNKAITTPNKNNKFYILYKLLPSKIKTNFRFKLSLFLGVSPNYLYDKMKSNSFNPYERAVISYHLGIAQEKLFPNKQKIVVVSQEYKRNNLPLYKYFFDDTKFDYDPKYITKILYSEVFKVINL